VFRLQIHILCEEFVNPREEVAFKAGIQVDAGLLERRIA